MLEWWNGRHEGLKILWPLRLCGFESHFEYIGRGCVMTNATSLFYRLSNFKDELLVKADLYIIFATYMTGV